MRGETCHSPPSIFFTAGRYVAAGKKPQQNSKSPILVCIQNWCWSKLPTKLSIGCLRGKYVGKCKSWLVVSHIFCFPPEPWGNDRKFDEYFSDGLVQPPTRKLWKLSHPWFYFKLALTKSYFYSRPFDDHIYPYPLPPSQKKMRNLAFFQPPQMGVGFNPWVKSRGMENHIPPMNMPT